MHRTPQVTPRVKSGGPDLNWGPLRPERSALPGCATPRVRDKVSDLGSTVADWRSRASPGVATSGNASTSEGGGQRGNHAVSPFLRTERATRLRHTPKCRQRLASS